MKTPDLSRGQEQDLDLNGNLSNSGTREVAQKKLNDPNLSPEQRKFFENQARVARGADYEKLIASRSESGRREGVKQDLDLNGNLSNSGTREVAQKKLNDPNLSPEQRKFFENQARVARGADYEKLIASRSESGRQEGVKQDLDLNGNLSNSGTRGGSPAMSAEELLQRHRGRSEEIREEVHRHTGKKPPRQTSANLDHLYKEAAEADPELRQRTRQLARDTNGRSILPEGLKGRDRAIEKALENGGDASCIRDLSRTTVSYRTIPEMYDGLETLHKNNRIEWIKDRYQEPLSNGYRDIIVNMRMSNGHVAEMQLTTDAMLQKKEVLGHDLYKQTRRIDDRLRTQNRSATLMEAAFREGCDKASRRQYDLAFRDSAGIDKTVQQNRRVQDIDETIRKKQAPLRSKVASTEVAKTDEKRVTTEKPAPKPTGRKQAPRI